MAASETIEAHSLLSDALVILGAAGIVIPLFARFRITPVIGFILVGMLVGPFGLGTYVGQFPWLGYMTISDTARLEPFAEFGIIMLLFTVGLELSFGRLWDMRKQVFGLGALELIGCAALIGSGLLLLGNPPTTALALGLALALSSTALVLRIVDPNRPVGRAALAMLLFEDIALIPIIFLLGAMGQGSEAQSTAELMSVLIRGAIVVAVLLVAGRLLFPRLFAQAARTKSPELFLAASLLVIIVASSATGAAGLGPIVGALIAGLLIAETEYNEEVETITKPFEGLALGVFLITVGMGLDLNALFDDPWPIIAGTAAILLTKAIVTGVLLRMMGARRGTSAEAGILMSSPSETTLIVLGAAVSAHLISREDAQFWQMITALGLTITPILAWLGRRLARRVDRGAPLEVGATPEEPRAIVIGFDRVGRLIGEMLDAHGRKWVAIDLDNDAVIRAQADGLPVVFGDATREPMLDKLGVENASAVVLTMDEPVLAQRLVKKLRARFPELPILARARDARHAASLYRAGASTAVPQTLESSLQLSEAVLVDIGVPMGPVIASIHEKRDEHRQLIREEGQLTAPPSLRSRSLRGRGPTGDGNPEPEPNV
ncbi:Kef-type potassium/proton antiporter (CPA2 family) [Novosphingobium kunmingense]|uniref:Kef-type potassium/proton antiporter (CPA2 family) n=1 Tax=Novosphingobium kunmingense TaxID=1211806 RepID=A0A2N0I1B5_9SPHN|nr:cation:proton antiporter [Novosphingobium kunmingense]PKB24941.1 Kef-type potassium/proton antiporter (CPA2 family) [Novosphingobium kunmingense]